VSGELDVRLGCSEQVQLAELAHHAGTEDAERPARSASDRGDLAFFTLSNA